MKDDQCPFCQIVQSDNFSRIIEQNSDAFLIEDRFPITPGHSLVISKRHVPSFFDTSPKERNSLVSLIETAKDLLEQKYHPSAYNIGISDGSAAGQTIPHLHVHLIPRYEEQDSDPRGGIRWIVPEKADYWSKQ